MSNPPFDVIGLSYINDFNFAGLIKVPTDPKN